ncbi:MAG: radical SAM protein [Chloroflexi bacterium]|nr:radical SAM protein [Chloroflexota bacterium]
MSLSQHEALAAEQNRQVVPTPSYVQIEPVGQCNLSCKMCPINFREDKPLVGTRRMMDYDLYCRIVDQFANIKTLHLQGLGEPTLHPRFFDMVTYAVQKSIRVTTNTNLTTINEARAELCVTSGLDTLHFSIDGTTAETYENIRLNARFDKVLRNLQNLVDARKRLGSDYPHLHMVMVIMRQNLAELPDLVRLAHRYGAEEVFAQQLSHDFGDPAFNPKFQPLNEYVHEQSLLYEDEARIEHYFGEARALAKEYGIRLRLPRPRPRAYPPETSGRDRCSWPWTSAYISFQGYAMPCCMAATPEQVHLGLIDGTNLEGIWNGEPYRQFREQLASGQPPEICKFCSIYNGNF